ncbi:MAG: hypothetical protein FVQ81_14730 [Candidatus Glassbacteria bacterium]|nr:hypothetical protein [Candidatus Glassbacteria bacterium]
MSNQLSKRPNMLIFWIMLASGVAVVLSERAGGVPGGALSIVSRTIFWCSAIAYFSIRIYQFAINRKRAASDEGEQNGPDRNE